MPFFIFRFIESVEDLENKKFKNAGIQEAPEADFGIENVRYFGQYI